MKLSASIVEQVLDYIKQLTTRGIDRLKTNQEPVPVILCGGGSILIDTNQCFAGVTEIIRPAHYAVCNAVGAALCSVSATIDSIVDLLPSSIDGGEQRKLELNRLILAAHEQCEQKGARSDTIRLVELEQVPLAYHTSGHKHRVQLTAVGQIDLVKFKQNEQEKRVQKLCLEVEKGAPPDIKPPVHVELTKKRPVFDDNGVWCVDPIDIEYIAYGTGILGNLFAFFLSKSFEILLQVVVVEVNRIIASCGVLKLFVTTNVRCVWDLPLSLIRH